MESYNQSSDSSSRSLRHFYRCSDCLSVVATETKIQPIQQPPAYLRSFGECGACGGVIEYLGDVHRDHLQRTEFRVPCDSRCTGALGPHCDCQCGGVNHGSRRVVEVVVETGKLPRVMVSHDAKGKGETYRALLQSVRGAHTARFGRVIEVKRHGAYLSVPDWCLFQEGVRLNNRILDARELRTHSARNRKLEALLNEITNGHLVGVCA
jgi:hypothetical protein